MLIGLGIITTTTLALAFTNIFKKVFTKLSYNLIIILISFNKLKAESISGNLVILQVLDKITARISTLEILVGENTKFGSLNIEKIREVKKTNERV